MDEDILELPDSSPLSNLEQEEEKRLLRQAVDGLDKKDREIFLRHYYYAQSVAQIASEMNMPESTVKTRLRRGRMKLKEYLTGRDI